MANPNMDLLIALARAMGPLCDQVVFVGGCATGLLVDNAELMDVRPTEDVDAIVEVASLAAWTWCRWMKRCWVLPTRGTA